jgi:hypothetical protein
MCCILIHSIDQNELHSSVLCENSRKNTPYHLQSTICSTIEHGKPVKFWQTLSNAGLLNTLSMKTEQTLTCYCYVLNTLMLILSSAGSI